MVIKYIKDIGNFQTDVSQFLLFDTMTRSHYPLTYSDSNF